MRIVAGKYGGRKLNVPKNKDIRPTSDKIRGAVFNMLASRDGVVGGNVLDGFCGTGALGLEALSRGADMCTFMDKARDSLDLARLNAQTFGAAEQSRFVLKDTQKIGRKTDKDDAYSLVFLDPPYAKGLISPCLQQLHQGQWLQQDAWLVCESERRAAFDLFGAFVVDLEKTYGATTVSLLRYQLPITPV